jgi:hypothetical protein
MKISFQRCGSAVGISIRAAINAWLNGHKAERTQTVARKENVPQITPGWDYRPRSQFEDTRLSTRHELKLPRA